MPKDETLPEYSGEAGTASAKRLPTLRDRIRHGLDLFLPKLALPLGVLVGAGLTAGTTYALVRRVQHLIATAAVSSDPEVWMNEARTKAYDPCYFGCNDCNNPSYAFDACAKTATANLTGVICDGNRIWNWKDRYPIECLQALGEVYKAEALEALKKRHRNQLAIIILTLLAGLIGGWVTYRLWNRMMQRRKRRAEDMKLTSSEWPRLSDAKPRRTVKTTTESLGLPENGNRALPGKGRRAGQVKTLFSSSLAFQGLRRASAYACAGYDEPHNQYFVNSNHTIFGVVRGWLSDCYDVTTCSTTCTPSCFTVGTAHGGSSTRCRSDCHTTCHTHTYSKRAPIAYVNDVVPRIMACGFQLERAAEEIVNLRVANAAIEKNLWVKISVNGYNVTSVMDTDEMVWCLHDIGGS